MKQGSIDVGIFNEKCDDDEDGGGDYGDYGDYDDDDNDDGDDKQIERSVSHLLFSL